MKKIILLSVLTGIAVNSMCQGPAQFGIFAGPQMTASKYTLFGKKQPNTYKYGFHAGVGWKIPFENNLYFSPAAFYSLKGYKVKLNQRAFPPDPNAVDNNTTLHTFELAFLLQCNFGKQPNHFFIKGGPSLDFQLFGKEKFNLVNNTTVDRNMRFTFGDYGRYAASMLLYLGYETTSGFVISGQYTHGMGSINNADNGPRIRHRAFGLSVGKYFTKKRK
jgi:hypothetical protein